jgi:ribonuclease HI
LGIATCNAAEYRALLLGLEYAAKNGFKYIRAQGDSRLVCNQVCCYTFATLHFAAFVFFHGTINW